MKYDRQMATVLNLYPMGKRTPWGEADHVEEYAPGVTWYSTPSHDGIPPQRCNSCLKGNPNVVHSRYDPRGAVGIAG